MFQIDFIVCNINFKYDEVAVLSMRDPSHITVLQYLLTHCQIQNIEKQAIAPSYQYK